MDESAFTYQVRSFAPVCVAAITRIGAPLAKAPNVLKGPTPVPISALPEITACWVSPALGIENLQHEPVLLEEAGVLPQLRKGILPRPCQSPGNVQFVLRDGGAIQV